MHHDERDAIALAAVQDPADLLALVLVRLDDRLVRLGHELVGAVERARAGGGDGLDRAGLGLARRHDELHHDFLVRHACTSPRASDAVPMQPMTSSRVSKRWSPSRRDTADALPAKESMAW